MKRERFTTGAIKHLLFVVSALLLLSSCTSNTATGAYTGAQFGHVVGSAIGGLTGGWKGQQKGTLIGVVGGAIAGAAIGSAVDKARERNMAPVMRQEEPQPLALVEIRNVRIDDADSDGYLKRGEECTVTFEVMNNGDQPVYNIRPTVAETTGNSHVSISPSLLIEQIEPHKGIRYTSTILADKRLKNGEIRLQVNIMGEGKTVLCSTDEMVVPTKKE